MTNSSAARRHGQRHPLARHGRGREGQFGPSGPAHGLRRRRDGAVHQGHEVRSRRSRMAGPRPLRALGRPRLDAALLRRSISSATRTRRSTRSRTSASSAPRPPATPSIISSRASRRPPARSARASPMPSAWRLRRPSSRAEFGNDLVDHHTWCLAGDGCLMEGISQEAISLAGHLKLNKLTLIWDNNGITIDGKVSNADFDRPDQALRGVRLEHHRDRRPRPGGGREGADRRQEERRGRC